MLYDAAIIERAAEIAAAAVDRLYAERPGLAARYGPAGRAKCVEDAGHAVRHLADSVWAGEPRVFCDYALWAVQTLSAHGVDRDDALRSLELVGETLDGRVPPAAAAVGAAHARAGVDAVKTDPDCAPPCEPGVGPGQGTLARRFLDALLDGRTDDGAAMIVDAFVHGVPLREVYAGVLMPVQREVGRLWQTRQITVAREHACTAAVSALMGRLAVDVLYRDRPRAAGRALAACVAGERHELGLRVAADLLDAAGWEVTFCGADTPAAALAVETARLRPRAVLLAASMAFNLRRVAEAIEAVRAAAPGPPPWVVVGGRAFAASPTLWARVGADALAADAAGVVDALADLAGRK